MHDRTALIEMRIERFVRERLAPAVYRDRQPLEISAWEAPGEPVTFDEARDAEYRPFAIGTPWGRAWGTTWFAVSGETPAAWRDDSGVLPAGTVAEFVVDLGFTAGQSGFQCEALIWNRDGAPIKGISPFNNATAAAVDADGRIDVLVEAASNPDVGSLFTFEPTPVGDPVTAGDAPLYVLREMSIGLRDVAVWELLQDFRLLHGLLAELDATSARRAALLEGMDAAIDAVDPHDVAGTAQAGRDVLAPLLAAPAASSAHVLHAVGHAHIDSAWLWPVRETARKVSRTFSNVLSLMDEDPEFVFASSSAQQFAWMKEHYPALWERLKARVAEGRFVPVGGMWVESDTNMVGGEAMARQFVEGKSFFLEEFGIDTEEVWLPDSFGYSGALPQIMKAAGARWFLTQKISWNETNRIPHHTFRWEGIDGSRIFTHFPPVDKYNSEVTAADLAHAERNFADKGRARTSLLPYGFGDGGGGPTREMTATIARTGSLEGAPIVKHSTPREFFETAEAEYADPAVWAGELYLEFHRGTYTSQLRTKQGNRRSEHLLREAELWSATAAVRVGATYPAEALRRLWRLVLLQQFTTSCPAPRSPGSTAMPSATTKRSRPSSSRSSPTACARSSAPATTRSWPTRPRTAAPALPPSRSLPRHPRGTSPRGRTARASSSTTASCARSSTDAVCSPRWSRWPAAARSCRRIARRGCSRCSAIRPPSGTHGTSTRPTGATSPPSTPPTPCAWTATLSSSSAARARPRSSRASPWRTAPAPCVCRSTSTGMSSRSCSSSVSPSTSTPIARLRRSSSGTSSAPPTRTPRGMRHASRRPRTAGCGSPSRASALPSPTTPPTATTSHATSAPPVGPRRSCASRSSARRPSPTPVRTRALITSRWASSWGPT